MNPKRYLPVVLLVLSLAVFASACSSGSSQNNSDTNSSASSAPKVVDTSPKAGDVNVDPATSELTITFDREMTPDSYSIVKNTTIGQFPELVGKPVISGDKKTYTQKIKLQPKTNYYISVNSSQYTNFKDSKGVSATPYVLEFETR